MASKILYVCQEITPYLPETEGSRLCRALTQAMQERGNEIRTFMPRYGCINERRHQLHEVIRLSGMNLIIDDNDHQLIIKVASIPAARVQIYFIDNDDYFSRKFVLTDEEGKPFPDNDERAIFFARGVLETVKKLRWAPDIIHCQGWMSSVIPFYVKTAYHDEPQFINAKVVTSLFGEQPAGDLGEKFRRSLPFREAKAELIEKYGDTFDAVELGKLAIDYSDGVVQVDDQVNAELVRYAQSENKPLIVHPQAEAEVKGLYADFYGKLLGE